MLLLPPPSLKHKVRQVIPKLVLLYAILNALGCDEVSAALNQPLLYFPLFLIPILQSGPENPSVNLVMLHCKTKMVGPYNGGSANVTLANTVSIAQICVPLDQIQKLVRLK